MSSSTRRSDDPGRRDKRKRLLVLIVACLVLVVGVVVLVTVATGGPAEPAQEGPVADQPADAGPAAAGSDAVGAEGTGLAEVTGEVEVKAADGTWVAAKGGQALATGAELRTHKAGRATVGLEGGGKLVLRGESRVKVTRPEHGGAVRLALKGKADVIARDRAKGIEVASEKHTLAVKLRFGRVAIESNDEGLQLDSSQEAGADVSLDSGGELKLGKGAKVALAKEDEQHLAVRLKMGDVDVQSTEAGKLGVKVLFGQGDDFVMIREGAAEVAAAEGGIRIKTKMGDVTVWQGDEETVLNPGSEVLVKLGDIQILSREMDVEDEELASPLVPISSDPGSRLPPVRAREGVTTRIFYDRRIPQVGFVWKEKAKTELAMLEIASKRSFARTVVRVPVSEGKHVLGGLDPGRYFWRVVQHEEGARKGGSSEPSQLVIRKDPSAARSGAGKVSDVVRDTGATTKIFFQQGEAPTLTFTWRQRQQAATYVFRLFSEADMGKPRIVRKTTEPLVRLARGKLRVGTYFWYQTALAADGREIFKSELNQLVIAFQNVTPWLRIDSPQPFERPHRGRIAVQGQLAKDCRLSVNGREIRIKPDGRFKVTLAGIRRGQVLNFMVKKGSGDLVYFVRHLGG